MPSIGISESGTVFCGLRFADLKRTTPPASVSYLHQNTTTQKWSECAPQLVSFSPSQRARTASRTSRPSVCAVTYQSETRPFFAVAILRCDTWAIQWIVERTGCLADAEILHLVAMSPSLVCGTYLAKNGSTGFFTASRQDVTRVSKAENRAWRSFAAMPKKLDLSISAGNVAFMKALSSSECLVLLKDGTLQMVTMSKEENDQGTWNTTEAVVDNAAAFKEFVSKPVAIASSPQSREEKCLLLYNAGGTSLEIAHLHAPANNSVAAVRTRVGLPKGSIIRHADFAGPFHLAVVLDDNTLLFVSLIPEGSGAYSTSNANPFRVPAPVVATWFDSSSEHHMVLCRRGKKPQTAEGLGDLFFWTCSFANGPYTQAELTAGEMNHVTAFSHLRGDGSISAEEEMKHFLSSAFRSERVDNNAPLKLHYVLAAANGDGSAVARALFSVETAPYVHTRLTQQWHNASTGLRVLLADESCSNCLRLQWNPRHLRRALRLMSAEQLTATFRHVASILNEQGGTQSSALFSECATAALSVGLQVITLSRQTGCIVEAADVESVAALLRAARASGHSTAKYANRMEMLLETCLQQRLVNRLLQGKQANKETDTSGEFFGVATEFHSERQLHTRYNANSWAEELSRSEATHTKVAGAASKYLAMAGTDDVSISDWKVLGARRGADALLNEFESTFVTFTN